MTASAVVSPFRSNEKLPRIPFATLVFKRFDVTEARLPSGAKVFVCKANKLPSAARSCARRSLSA